MCGIVGIVGSARADRVATMRAMRDRIVHRGPDSAGEYVDDRAALGVRRLRVIDLVTGDQPLTNEDRSVWTVFNGEIYNFHELRDALSAAGHTFATKSDTEVIPHLYEEHGPAFVEHLDGMFALAVWDARSGTLIAARDRLGKKPLLYLVSGSSITFASEHEALRSVGPAVVDRRAIRLYARLGYVPAPHDALEGVRKLEAGHVLVWRSGKLDVRPYWVPIVSPDPRIGEPEAIEETRRLLDEAIRKRLVADVPIGAFLSGGLDSSAVVASMAQSVGRVRTFTIGFDDPRFSETAHARLVAERFGTEHHEFTVQPLQAEALPLLVRHYGEPYADSSALPTYYLSKLTRGYVTVALNGDGGDETFAGYDRYRAAVIAARLDRLPRAARSAAARAVARFSIGDLRTFTGRAARFIAGLDGTPSERYLDWTSVFGTAALGSILTAEFAAETADADEALREEARLVFDTHDPVRAAQLWDMRHYLTDDLLVKVDIASMSCSLEVRSPLLDRSLVDFALRIPTNVLMPSGRQKHVLRGVLADRLPAAILDRPKHGFGVPIAEWLRADLRPLVHDTVLSPAALGRGYFRPDAVRRLVSEHEARSRDHSHRIWALLMLELWHREVANAAARKAA